MRWWPRYARIDNEREAWSNQRVGKTSIAISLPVCEDGAVHSGVKFPDVCGPARYDFMRYMRSPVPSPTSSSDIACGPSENGVEKMHVLSGLPTN